MDYNNDGEMWPWQGKEYYLDESYSLDISNCTLNGLTQNGQDLFCMLNGKATPVRDSGGSAYLVPQDDSMRKELEQSTDVSLQVKSRRMLQFDLEHSGFSIGNEEVSTFFRSKKREDSFQDDFSEISEWVSSKTEDTSLACLEVLDESSEGWIASCFNDAEMQFNPEDMNISAASDVHVDIADINNLEAKHETTTAQRHPVGTRRGAALKGKKPFVSRPTQVSSSVVYPFAFIKPCGLQGVVTLEDINQRIHTPPPSKIKKRDEDQSLYPTSSFSGKPVVGKTKIHTEGGKGSITIMRTKG